MVINPDPFLILDRKLMTEVGQEVFLLFVSVQEIELSPDDGQLPLSAYGVCLPEFLLVRLFLDGELWVVDEIDSEVITENTILCFRIPKRG